MLWVKISTHVADHPRFLEAGAVARDLWSWGMLYAGKHETDGELPMAAVLATAWGAGMKANIRAATKLVQVGLWERTDFGFRILRWAEQGNMTKWALEADRKAAKVRMNRRRAPECSPIVRANERRTSVDVPTSTSLSVSESRSREPQQTEIASTMPEWFQTALDVIEANVGERLPPGESWLRYSGHRAGKGIEPTIADAQYWLTSVMVPERRKGRDEARHREDRDKAFDAQRRKERDGPVVPSASPLLRERADWEATAATPEEAAKAGEALRRLLGKVGT